MIDDKEYFNAENTNLIEFIENVLKGKEGNKKYETISDKRFRKNCLRGK